MSNRASESRLRAPLFGIALLASAFAIGARLARDTEGLV